MPLGPGIYDKYCKDVLIDTQAGGVLLIVLDGKNGSGFSADYRADRVDLMLELPNILRNMAEQIEVDII